MAYTKLTPDTEEKLLNYIRMGLPIVQSCSLVGIVEKTYYNWIDYAKDESREDQEIFLQFLQKLKKAEAEAQANLVNHIQKDSSWQSKAWILERRWNETWGNKEKREVEHKGKIEVDLDDPEVKARIERIEKKLIEGA